MTSSWHVAAVAVSGLALLVGVAACEASDVGDPTGERASAFEPAPTTPEAGAGSPSPGPSEEGMCCTAGCGPIFQTSWPDFDDATLQTSKFSFCRNTECYEISLADVVLPSPAGGIAVPFDTSNRDETHAALVYLHIWGREEPGASRRLGLDYLPWASNDWKDGDVYEVTMTDGEGSVLAHRQEAVTYTTHPVCCQICPTATLDGGT